MIPSTFLRRSAWRCGAGAAASLLIVTLFAPAGCTSGRAMPATICGGHVSGTPAGRPVAVACTPSSGAVSCSASPDCGASADECFTDATCAPGRACVCADQQGGNATHANLCITSVCRVDTDCAGGGPCSPTSADLCSGGGPFFACHSSADECRVDADCCNAAPVCRYEQTVGHWACAARCAIAG